MPIELHAFALPLIISALILLSISLLILQRRNVRGGLPLAVLMLELSWWAGNGGVLALLSKLSEQVFWLKLSHAALVAVPAGERLKRGGPQLVYRLVRHLVRVRWFARSGGVRAL